VSLPASFGDFIGNADAVTQLRRAIAAGRLPHSLILAGPSGAGKYTLALMLAQALHCELQPREIASDGSELAGFCGKCTHCERIAQSADLETRIEEAVAAREDMRETDRKDTRILIQTHPDLLVLPPDPPQLLVKVGQVRTLIQGLYYRPAEARSKIYLFPSSAFMKEAANALLKVLEEPPEHAHIFILAENPGELLPTIRSRCALVRLGALPLAEIEVLLATRHPEWRPQERSLVAKLSGGAVGRALEFDLAGWKTSREKALTLLRHALENPDHTELFKLTETFRAGADGAQNMTALLRILGSLLGDLLALNSGVPALVHNVDILPVLQRLADAVDFDWLEQAVRGADQVEAGMRRNLLRPLSLDAFASDLVRVGGRTR
jgi:DNA polymerase-3 subunit delta'